MAALFSYFASCYQLNAIGESHPLRLPMACAVVFEDISDTITLPKFRPA